MGGHGSEVDVRSTNKIAGVYSNKKKGNSKIVKTQKKLPDLNTVGHNEYYYKKPAAGGFASDSEEYLNSQQLPMIKGGGSNQAQNVANAYNPNQASGAGVVMGPQVHLNTKNIKKNMNNSNFMNQSKYVSGNVSTNHNNSQSPASQTFFKDNSSKTKNQQSPIGKKGLPGLKKKNVTNMYVSSYSKNPNQK